MRGSEWILLIYPAMRVYFYARMKKKGLMWLSLASLFNISLLKWHELWKDMATAYAEYRMSPALVLIFLCNFSLSGGCLAHVDL